MIWLLLSILCSTVIFIVFKLFERYRVPNLPAIVVNYGVAATLGFVLSSTACNPACMLQAPWRWSIVLIGFLFISLFQIMARVSQQSGVAVVSVVVKMSLAIPVLFGVLYWQEPTGPLKWTGIIAALVAVYFTAMPAGKPALAGPYLPALALLFLGSGFLDSFLSYNQKLWLPEANDQLNFTAWLFSAAGVMGLFWMGITASWRQVTFRAILGGIALGLPNLGSIYFLLQALKQPEQESSWLFPVNNVGIVALSAATGALLFKEPLTGRNKWGLVIALVALICMSVWK